jgi:quercetin dioxygenase-like cupin family protein
MADAVFMGADEGDRVGHPLGGAVAFKVRGDQSDGVMTAFETAVAPGEGPPLHIHASEDETLYVVEGDVRFKLGDELSAGGPGSFVFVPRGVRHTFQNVGGARARILIHFSPSGMERFFERFAALDAPDPSSFATVGAGVGMTVVGPPLSVSDPI